MQWVRQQASVAGILTPDIDGKRILLDISTNQLYPLQTDGNNMDTIAVGKFLFSKAVFLKGKEILEHALAGVADWLVIDEVGKLEIERDQGWEPAVAHITEAFAPIRHRKLLLVVRDSLLNAARERYCLQHAHVINDLTGLQ